jgi:hypothetical protein
LAACGAFAAERAGFAGFVAFAIFAGFAAFAVFVGLTRGADALAGAFPLCDLPFVFATGAP